MIIRERRNRREARGNEEREKREDREHKEVTSILHDEVIHIILASHKYNFMINYSHHFLSTTTRI